MTIVALKKLTLCGLSDEKPQVLAQLQKMGGAHLIALKEYSECDYSKKAGNAHKALKYLNLCANKRHQLNNMELFDFAKVVNEVLDIQFNNRQLADRRDALRKRIQEIQPWGDFRLPEEGLLKLWFYIVPEHLMQKLQTVDLVWQVVHKDNLNSYVVVISDQEPPFSSMPVARTHTGKSPLSELKNELDHIELELEDLQAQRESLTRWIGLIAANLAEAEDESALDVANAITLDREGIFIIQAWVPESDLARFEQFTADFQLAVICEEPKATDKPPTLLKNTEPLAGGEDLVNFYQTPGYFTWDPSGVVFFSFAVFFAMILSDAGYAGLFAFLLAIKWRSLGKSKKRRRLRMLASITIIFSLVWGVFTASYFGYIPPKESLLGALKLVDMNDIHSMMRLSIAVGVIHIALANGVMAYQRRGKPIALASLGWLAVVIGGFIAGYATHSLLQQTGYGLLIAGSLSLLLFSSEHVIVKPADWLWRILHGLKSLSGVAGLFGDVLSYMRLFALGLASASLALAFNQYAAQVYHALPGIGLLFSILIFIAGHALNLLLCLMSGVVHGLRLNFIEFYNWSILDEGYPFKAFAKKGVE